MAHHETPRQLAKIAESLQEPEAEVQRRRKCSQQDAMVDSEHLQWMRYWALPKSERLKLSTGQGACG